MPGTGSSRSHASACASRVRAVLYCGEAVYYSAASLAPSTGDLVPCARHGYCAVAAVSRWGMAPEGGTRSTRRSRRSLEELLRHLRGVDAQSASQLRRDGFTLRLVEAARARGAVAVDDTGPNVLVRLVEIDPATRAAGHGEPWHP